MEDFWEFQQFPCQVLQSTKQIIVSLIAYNAVAHSPRETSSAPLLVLDVMPEATQFFSFFYSCPHFPVTPLRVLSSIWYHLLPPGLRLLQSLVALLSWEMTKYGTMSEAAVKEHVGSGCSQDHPQAFAHASLNKWTWEEDNHSLKSLWFLHSAFHFSLRSLPVWNETSLWTLRNSFIMAVNSL